MVGAFPFLKNDRLRGRRLFRTVMAIENFLKTELFCFYNQCWIVVRIFSEIDFLETGWIAENAA